MRHFSHFAPAMLITAALIGCGDDTPAPGTATTSNDDSPQFATPEAAYQAFKDAAEADDWENAANLLTEESQIMLAGSMAFGASMMTMDPEKGKDVKILLKKHGIDPDEEDEEDAAEDAVPTDPVAMMRKITAPIKDKPVFIGEIMAWMNKNSPESESAFDSMGALSDVEIKDATAKASVETPRGPMPIEFHQVEGSWLVHLPTDAPPGGIDESPTTPGTTKPDQAKPSESESDDAQK